MFFLDLGKMVLTNFFPLNVYVFLLIKWGKTWTEVSIFAFVCVGNFTNGNYKEFHSLAKGGSDISISPNYPSFQQLAPFSAVLNYSLLFTSPPVAAYRLSKIQSSLLSMLLNSPFALSYSMLKPKWIFLFLGNTEKHRVIFCSLEAFIIFLVECAPVIRSRMWIVLPKYHCIKVITV